MVRAVDPKDVAHKAGILDGARTLDSGCCEAGADGRGGQRGSGRKDCPLSYLDAHQTV